MMKNPTELDLTFVKSTKGTHVYGSDADDAPIKTVYIQRESLPKNPPQMLAVTLTYEDE